MLLLEQLPTSLVSVCPALDGDSVTAVPRAVAARAFMAKVRSGGSAHKTDPHSIARHRDYLRAALFKALSHPAGRPPG